MNKTLYLTGQRFGRWTVIGMAEPKIQPSGQRKQQVKCQCDCGTVSVVQKHSILSGNSQSCGCLLREIATACNTKHGMRNAPEYRVWCGMRKRCNKPSDHKWPDYGGRGIKVCPEWEQFEAFYKDMGPKPSTFHSIDRIDNDGDYCPENCRWATRREQAVNRRNNVRICINGQSMTLCEAAELHGLKYDTVWMRRHKGWPEEDWFLPAGTGWRIHRKRTEP